VAEQIETLQQLYTPGSDVAVGFESTQLVWGRSGNDVLLGFQPVVPNPFLLQLDILLGDLELNDFTFRQWRDVFVLGDWQRPYYANSFFVNGVSDFAVIADFNPALDQVQLFGNPSNYYLIQENNNTVLAIQKPTGVDVVAYFLNTSNLNLNAPYFQYKGNATPPIAIPQAKQIGTAGYDILVRNAVDTAGNVIVAGGTNGTFGAPANNNSRDAAIVKYNAQGTELWRRQFGTSRFDTIYDVGTDAQGNIYVTGATYGNLALPLKEGTSSDVFLTKLTPDGQTLWTRQFGSTSPLPSTLTAAVTFS
jgi:Beta-propeller repeat